VASVNVFGSPDDCARRSRARAIIVRSAIISGAATARSETIAIYPERVNSRPSTLQLPRSRMSRRTDDRVREAFSLDQRGFSFDFQDQAPKSRLARAFDPSVKSTVSRVIYHSSVTNYSRDVRSFASVHVRDASSCLLSTVRPSPFLPFPFFLLRPRASERASERIDGRAFFRDRPAFSSAPSRSLRALHARGRGGGRRQRN